MLTEFIRSLLNFRFSKPYEPRFEDGRFTLLNKSLATFKAFGEGFKSNLQLATDFQVTGLSVDVYQHDGETNYSGFNRKYITDSGVYDPVAALEEFSKVGYGKRLTKGELDALTATQIGTDSHEAFIYNMLVSWYKAKLYKDTKSKDMTLKVAQGAYVDSHVTIGYQGQVSEITHEIPLGIPNYEAVGDIDLLYRKEENFWDRPYILRYNASGHGQTEFYLLHVLGREGYSALNVDIDIEPLDTTELLLDPVGGGEYTAIQAENVPWAKPETLWLWIIDYVRLNRVEHAFAAALELLGALSAQPLPSYQESNHWQRMKHRVSLAKFSPTRARIRSNLEGEAYVQDTQAHELMEKESPHPQNFLFVSAITNYYVWVGLYALVDNYSRGLEDWTNAFRSSEAEMATLVSPFARAACVSAITGKEFVTCANRAAHVAFDLSAMAENTTVGFDVIHDSAYPTSVTLKGPHPYVSGSLILGSLAGQLHSTVHLKAMQSFTVDSYGTVNTEDAIVMANAYRLFGHQLQLTHERYGDQYQVYAPARECVIDPAAILNYTRDVDLLLAEDATERPGRSHMLPDPMTIRGAGVITFTVTTPAIEAVSWGKRQKPLSVSLSLPGRRRPIEFKIRAGVAYTPVTMRARTERAGPQRDFHREEPELAPTRPGAPTGPADTTAAPNASEPEAAESVV